MTKTGQWVCAAIFALLAACSSSHTDSLQGGETNWLRECSEDGACGEYGSCVCELCTEECMADEDCPSGLVCKPASSALVSSACGSASTHGLCAPECEGDRDCGGDQACVSGACTPLALAGADGGAISGPDGSTPQSSDAFVIAALAPDSDCVWTRDSRLTPIGAFDVSSGASSASEGCRGGYRVYLNVASYRADVVQLSGAEVTIQTLDRRVVVFNRGETELPNPLMFTSSPTVLPPDDALGATRGVYAVDAIPIEYAEQLDLFDGKQILLEIRPYATDGEGTSISFSTFVFPVDICVGCLSVCLQRDVIDAQLSPEDVYGGNCADNAGADGRICIDSDC